MSAISNPYRSLPPWSNLLECHCQMKKDHSLVVGALFSSSFNPAQLYSHKNELLKPGIIHGVHCMCFQVSVLTCYSLEGKKAGYFLSDLQVYCLFVLMK